ncbi:AraC family transcriptional regulator [Flavobacterium sp. j3]|uniref:AraC family transcriptional regulator n=1 Tax=Flavobacterium aureirubrum TaxID=3133147 RepID=A0ABU9NBQ3_9FLAO
MLINKAIASDNSGNEIRVSSVFNYENKIEFNNFSAKYVLSGKELYQLNNKKYSVSSGEYVVGNKSIEASIIIDSKEPVKGICIDIAKSKIEEIIDFSFSKNQTFKKFIFEQEWMSKKYNAASTNLGYAINQIAQKVEENNTEKTFFTNDIFYSLAECIVKDQEYIFTHFQSLKAIKEETNGKLLDFIYDAKNFMDTHYLDKINLDTIALEAKISQYHFIRLFKKMFNVTPYQYISQKRLHLAKALLLEGTEIIDCTYITGFSNPANFSKAFKNEFGIPPKNMKCKN